MNVQPVDPGAGAGASVAVGNRSSAADAAAGASAHPGGRAGKGFPAPYAGMTPIRKISWLAGQECAELLSARRLQPAQVQAEMRRLKKSAARISTLVPSPARLEEFWRGYPFPPPGARSPMCRASRVLDESERPVLWPACYLSGSGATYDVIVYETEARRAALELKPQRGESSSQSPSAEALRVAQAAGAIIDTGVKLLTEDEQVLKQQIDRYLTGKKTSLLDPDAA